MYNKTFEFDLAWVKRIWKNKNASLSRIRTFYSYQFNLTILICIHCVLPLLLGGLIYVLFRPLTLKMFTWFEYIALMDSVQLLRAAFQKYTYYPDWFYYSLPDGLWTYSFTSSFILIWSHSSSLKYWLSIPLSLSLIPEILQYFNFLTGTFDLNDLIFQLFGFLFSIFLFQLDNRFL